jgi:hypothetical protein
MTDTPQLPKVAFTKAPNATTGKHTFAVALVPDCDAPMLFRHEPTGILVLCVSETDPKRDTLRLLCALLEAEVKHRTDATEGA